MPVVSVPVHAAFPQMQGAALLGADPSVILQAEAVTPEARKVPSLLHLLSAAMQNIPVVVALSQSADPHLQLPPSFAEVPSAKLHSRQTLVLPLAFCQSFRQFPSPKRVCCN